MRAQFFMLLMTAALCAAGLAEEHAHKETQSAGLPDAGQQLPDPLQAGWQGEPVCELVHDDAQQRLLRCTFAPGVGHERHYHAPHVGYVLVGGRMRITDAKGTREIDTQTHSSWQSDGVEWHEVLNVGETTASYLVFESKIASSGPTEEAQ